MYMKRNSIETRYVACNEATNRILKRELRWPWLSCSRSGAKVLTSMSAFFHILIWTSMAVSFIMPWHAMADSTQTAVDKPGTGALPMQSIVVWYPNGATVTPPNGWVAGNSMAYSMPDAAGVNFTAGTAVEYNGNLPVGGSASFTFGGSRNNLGVICGFDWTDANNVKKKGNAMPDPMGALEVDGGASGTTYLGYTIPANQYGYFFIAWDNPGGPSQVNSSTFYLGSEDSGAYNVQALNYTFSLDSLNAVVPGNPYYMSDFMDQANAISGAGVSTSWSLDAAAGTLTTSFDALTAGEASQVIALTTTSPLDVLAGTEDPPCPEPSSLALLFLGAIPVLAHYRWQRKAKA